jgi:hypothetical protein
LKTIVKTLAICVMARWPGGSVGIRRAAGHSGTGSFSAGGTIITAPGTFDAKKPLDSAGQTYHGDHASVFYQIPVNPHKYPIVMLHGAGQFLRTWKAPRMVAKGSRTYSCVADSQLILSISRVGAAPGARL